MSIHFLGRDCVKTNIGSIYSPCSQIADDVFTYTSNNVIKVDTSLKHPMMNDQHALRSVSL